MCAADPSFASRTASSSTSRPARSCSPRRAQRGLDRRGGNQRPDHLHAGSLRHAPGPALPHRRRHGQRALRRHVDRDSRLVQRPRLSTREAPPAPDRLLAVDALAAELRVLRPAEDPSPTTTATLSTRCSGWPNLILFEVERHSPRAVVLCFGAEAADYRTQAFEPYHADRPPMPGELERQWARRAPVFFDEFGWTTPAPRPSSRPTTCSARSRRSKRTPAATRCSSPATATCSSASAEHVTVLFPRGGKDGPEIVGPDEVRERYGIEPEAGARLHRDQGRPVRRAAGREGHRGEGRARPPAQARHARGRHRRGAQARRDDAAPGRRADATIPDALRAFKDIATLRDVDLARPPDAPTDGAAAAAAARERGMNRLAERLEKLAAA